MTEDQKLIERARSHKESKLFRLRDMLDDVTALADRLEASLEREGWKTIDTHDGSGEPVFAICASAYTPTPFEAWFFDGAWRKYDQPEEKRSSGVAKWFPTHWMPKSALPPAPEGK